MDARASVPSDGSPAPSERRTTTPGLGGTGSSETTVVRPVCRQTASVRRRPRVSTTREPRRRDGAGHHAQAVAEHAAERKPNQLGAQQRRFTANRRGTSAGSRPGPRRRSPAAVGVVERDAGAGVERVVHSSLSRSCAGPPAGSLPSARGSAAEPARSRQSARPKSKLPLLGLAPVLLPGWRSGASASAGGPRHRAPARSSLLIWGGAHARPRPGVIAVLWHRRHREGANTRPREAHAGMASARQATPCSSGPRCSRISSFDDVRREPREAGGNPGEVVVVRSARRAAYSAHPGLGPSLLENMRRQLWRARYAFTRAGSARAQAGGRWSRRPSGVTIVFRPGRRRIAERHRKPRRRPPR